MNFENMNILTFDIEDWYCHDNYSQNFDWESHPVRIYESIYKMLDVLDENEVKGTFFCLGWLADHHPDVITEIAKRGHEIGCHSYQHQLAYRFDREGFKQDTLKAKSLIEDLTGQEVLSYRAPSYSITANNTYCFDVLVELGFKYDCSVFPTSRECGGYPDYGSGIPGIIRCKHGDLKEFPMNTFRLLGKDVIFSGGGYFRILPYKLIKYMASHSDYVVSYFHPSDFDPGQPKMKHLPLMRQLKNELGLKGAFKMYQKYIKDFDFLPLTEADKMVDWSKTKVIDIH